MKEYNIYYCSDNNGLQLLKQSINSIGKNCKNNYIIHCLTAYLDKDEIDNLKNYFNNFKNLKVIVYDCSNLLDGKFDDYEKIAFLKHISKTTMLRMYVNKIINLKNIDKLLYIDTDTYINKELDELFNTDLNGYYIGAVRDTFINWSKNFQYRRDKFYLDMIRKNTYFNGGVELLNIKSMIDDDVFGKLQKFELKSYMKLTDQDIYNVVFNGKVKYLDLKFNCKWWMNFNKDDMTIIHAAGHKKQLKYLKLLSLGLYKSNNEYREFNYYNDLNIKANDKLLNPDKSENNYNIYYCTDYSKFDLMKMSILSLIKNSNKKSKYTIHCLTYGINETDISTLNILNTNNIEIIGYDCTKILDELGNYVNYRNSNTLISKVTMLRMYIDKILDLSNIDKILYLDTDTYINQDLEYLFETDLTDKYIGAVRDIIVLWSGAWDSHEYYDKFRNKSNYFNGGVELLNVKEMLKDNKFYELQMSTFNDKKYELADQDIYNEVLGKKVKYLDLYFNYKWWLDEWNFDYIQILHFAGCKKKQKIYMNFLLNDIHNIPHKCKWNLNTTNSNYYLQKNFELEK